MNLTRHFVLMAAIPIEVFLRFQFPTEAFLHDPLLGLEYVVDGPVAHQPKHTHRLATARREYI